MNKIIALGITAACGCALSAHATVYNVSQLTTQGYNVGQGGGEFNVNPVTGVGYAASVLVNGGFETFCVSQNVGIAVPGSYNGTVNAAGVYAIDEANDTKTIALGTAYLFQQFATGVLGLYDYTDISGGESSIRAHDAYLLQLAIWTLEGTYGYGTSLANTTANLTADLSNIYVNEAANEFGGGTAGLLAAMGADGAGGFGVGTLNLTWISGEDAGKPAQSMLTLLPDGGTTIGLLGMALTGLAFVSRKVRTIRS